MKTVFIYITLVITLMSTASSGQLLKLPILISHYFEHKQNDPSIGLLEFLTMHYATDDGDDNDNDRDMQLPFKSYSHHCCNPPSSILASPPPISRQKQFFEKHEFAVINDSTLRDPAHASLFRPPRI